MVGYTSAYLSPFKNYLRRNLQILIRFTAFDNQQAFADAMRKLWENPEKTAAMGRVARERYSQVFTADKMAQAYVNLYRELAKNSKVRV